MRTFIAEENVASNVGYKASLLVDDYKAIWGLSLPEYQVHCRYSLIDTVSGYRNNHRKMSFLMPVESKNNPIDKQGRPKFICDCLAQKSGV